MRKTTMRCQQRRLRRSWLLCTALAAVFGQPTTLKSADSDDAISLIMAYWDRIQTVRLDYQVLTRTPKWGDQVSWGEYYWRADGSAGRLDTRRMVQLDTGEWLEEVGSRSCLGRRLTEVGYLPQLSGAYEVRGRLAYDPHGWVRGISPPHDFNCVLPPAYTWPEVIQEAAEFSVTLEQWLEGELALVRVRQRNAAWEHKALLDPARGFLPVRQELSFPTTGGTYTLDVVDAFEASAGLWYPTHLRRTSTGPLAAEGPDAGVMGSWVSDYWYSNVEINGELPDAIFTIEFPAGTKVNDKINKRRYVIAAQPGAGDTGPSAILLADGRRAQAIEKHVSEALTLASAHGPPAAGGSADTGGAADWPAGVPRVMGWWILFGAIFGIGSLVPLTLIVRRLGLS